MGNDVDGRTNIKYIDGNMTLSNDKIVILRWTESTKAFSILSDISGICTLNISQCNWANWGTNGYQVTFFFTLNDLPPINNNEFACYIEDDDGNWDYQSDLEVWDLEGEGVITIDSVEILTSEPCYQNHDETEDYHENWIDVNVTISNSFGYEFITFCDIVVSNVGNENSTIESIVYNWLWGFGGWFGKSYGASQYVCDDGLVDFLSYGYLDETTMWIVIRFRLKNMDSGLTYLTITAENNINDIIGKIETSFNLGATYDKELINEITQDLEFPPPNVNEDKQITITTSLFIKKGADVNLVQKIDEGIMIWVNGELVYNSFERALNPAYLGAIRLYDSADNLIEDNDWLYVGELYKLQVDAYNPSYVGVNISDTRRTLWFEYYNSTNLLSVRVSDKTGYVVGLVSQFNEFNESTGLRQLEWRFMLDDNIVDATNRYWSAIFNSTINAPFYIPLEEDNKINWLMVNIYNLGGFVSYLFTGDGKRIDGGDIYDIEATTIGSTAYAEVIFYNLQHVHILPELYYEVNWDAETGRFENFDGGYYEYGISYELDDEWINGWKVRLYPTKFAVGHQNLGIDYDYVGWAIEWYQYNHVTSTWNKIREEIIYANCWGYDNENADPTYHNRTSSQLWIDLWFSNHESSTIVAGRVNAYYYGMYEQGTSFWFGYGTFRPLFGNVTASMFFGDLVNTEHQVDDSYGIGKVKFWAKIEKQVGNDRTWRMHNFEVKNYQLASGRMEGIDNPPLVETKVLDMPSTGFLTPLIKIISSLGKIIANALAGISMAVFGALDTFFIYMGLPPIFSILTGIFISLWKIGIIILDSFEEMVGWLIESLNNVIMSIFLIIPRYILFVGVLVDVFLQYYNTIILVFTGGLGDMSNFWNDYPVMDIIQLWLVCIFPFIEIAKIESSDDPIGTLKADVMMFIEIVKGLFDFLYGILGVLLDIIGRIISILPF